MPVAAAVAITVMMSLSAAAGADTCNNAAFRTALSAHLGDCRAYEQVSPSDKNGLDAIQTGGGGLYAVRASATEAGSPPASSIVYMGVGSYANPLGSELANAYLSSREDTGWHTASLAPPTPQATPPGGYYLGYDFSPDLSQYVLKIPLQNLLQSPETEPAPPTGVYNLYLHHPDGNYSLLTTAPPVSGDPEECSVCIRRTDEATFAGASSDFSHVIFETNESLLGTGAPGSTVESLYESTGGVVHLVGILPDGAIAIGGSQPGAGASRFYSSVNLTADHNINHAISADGSHVLFEAAADGGAPYPGQNGLTELYDRIGGASTIEVSAPAAGATPANPAPEPAQFWAASADGSLVYFTSSAELTTQSNTGAGNASQDLYRYDVASGSLTDLTIDTNALDAASGAGVQGVVGASEDGSYLYFVAKGQLLPGKGVDGQPNLYLSHAGQLRFIATLSEADARDWTFWPGELKSYVTPDGRHLALMSANSLTGYDNHDQSSGAADIEVYEYSADSDQLACASCDPSGTRPVGSAFIGGELEAWVSTPFYQPRTLNDDGSRLFFSSPSPLVPGVANGHVNVFEFEGGAIHLISSGKSESDDFFLDASPSGNDVFFATRQQLLPSDQDNLIDVYDAHVGGGFPSPASPPASCTGSVCQGPSSAPPAFPSGPSLTLTGAGNLPQPQAAKPAKPRKPKPKARKKPHKKKSPHRKSRTGKRASHRSRGA
jgi:hypothetical protein